MGYPWNDQSMASMGVEEPTKLKVFISHSRKDEDFAQDLLGGLEAVGFEPYRDKQDIATGREREARLGRLIEAADHRRFRHLTRLHHLRALRVGSRSRRQSE